MDDAKQWLQEKGVAALMDRGIKALIDAKPEDPALFLSQYYMGIHEKGVGGGEGVVATEIGHSTLVAVVKGDRVGVVVVDLRDEGDSTTQGHVNGAVLWDVRKLAEEKQEFCDEVLKDGTKTIILTGNCKPDGDEAGQALLDAAKHKLTIYTMSSVSQWVDSNRGDTDLVSKGLSRNFSHRRGSNAGLRIDVPEAPETMSAAALPLLLRDNNGTTVVDVRESTAGGSIKGALHIPCSELVANIEKATASFKNSTVVVFASHVSPDLDMTAATPLVQALHEVNPQIKVFILSGGIKGWLTLHGTDPDLVDGLPSTLHDAGMRERKRRSTTISVEVPESPPQVTPAELSALMLNSNKKTGGLPWVIVDVSVDSGGHRGKGKITGSVQKSSEEVLEGMQQFVSQNKDKELIIVVSMMAHDLDEAVAVPMQQAFQDAGSNASIVTLIGGLKRWIADNHKNPSLVEELVPSSWGIEPHPPRRNSTIRRHRPGNITVPEAPQKIPPLEVKLLVNSQSAAIVDVRPSPTGGRIKGSVVVSMEDILGNSETVAQQWGDKDIVIFVSLLSPDLDLVAATAVMQALRGSKRGTQVSYLMGGLASWMVQYGLDPELTEGYEPAQWVERRHSHERC